MEYKLAFFETGLITHGVGPVHLQLKAGWVYKNIIIYSGGSYHLYATKGSDSTSLNAWKVLIGGKYRYYFDDWLFVSGGVEADGKYFNKLISIGLTIR